MIKADGLAAGKGVIWLALSEDEAHAAIDDMLLGNKIGNAGARVVIEDFLQGERPALLLMVDGANVPPMATRPRPQAPARPRSGAQHRAAWAPTAPRAAADALVYERAMNEIICPPCAACRPKATLFSGFLYAGLMIDSQGAPYTIEFNCRFGDPETQPIMSRLKSDLADLLEAGIAGKLDGVEAQWLPQTAVGVVLAAAGYPDTPRKGDIISGLDEADQIGKVFHAGTSADAEGRILTNGGRVLCVVGLGRRCGLRPKRKPIRRWARCISTACNTGAILPTRRLRLEPFWRCLCKSAKAV